MVAEQQDERAPIWSRRHLRVLLGLANLMNPNANTVDPTSDEYDTPIEVRRTMAYVGAAFGFGL